MNYHDPSRQRLNGLPMLYFDSKPVCVVPTIMVRPLIGMPADIVHADVILSTMISPTTARYFSSTVHWDKLQDFFDLWYTDPEAVLLELGWSYSTQPAKPEKPRGLVLSLEDLGL